MAGQAAAEFGNIESVTHAAGSNILQNRGDSEGEYNGVHSYKAEGYKQSADQMQIIINTTIKVIIIEYNPQH
ncbi:hypothetical protein SLIQ_09135 [Serratia liquefaciens FK01]|nr:hypothetical protein SLIQ_09135 [Serratia liquefaciens FK01]